MYVKALRAANTAAQEARALAGNVSKQRQVLTKDTLEQVKRLDSQGHARQMRDLHQKRQMALIDAETSHGKALGNAVMSALAIAGTAVTAAVMIGQRLADRASGVFNPAEEARLEEEAGRTGGTRLKEAERKFDQAKQRLEHVQKQVREKEARSWFPGLGPSFAERQELAQAKQSLANAQEAVYAAGGDREIRKPDEQLPPHLRNQAATDKPTTTNAATGSPERAAAPLPSHDPNDPQARAAEKVVQDMVSGKVTHYVGATHADWEAAQEGRLADEPPAGQPAPAPESTSDATPGHTDPGKAQSAPKPKPTSSGSAKAPDAADPQPPAARKLTPAEEQEAHLFDDLDYLKEHYDFRRKVYAGLVPDNPDPESTRTKTWVEQATNLLRSAIDWISPHLDKGLGWFLDVTTGSVSLAHVGGDGDTAAGEPPKPAAAKAANPDVPAQPVVTTRDGNMPLVTATPGATAASQWGTNGAQPLPLKGKPDERLHALLDLARKGELTRGTIVANKDLFNAEGLTRLQAGLLADLGASNNGRRPSGALVTAEIQRALDQTLGFGKTGALSPAMRQALLPKAAENLLNAANAYRSDPSSEANRRNYDQARRDYEDLKYGDLEVDGRVQGTGLLHLLGAEMKQAFEPMDVIDPETGKREGDLIARMLSAVEFARNTAEAAIKEEQAARDSEGIAQQAMTMIRQAEAEAGMYGIGPGAGGGGSGGGGGGR